MLIDKWKEHFEQEIKETNIILQKGYTGSIKHAARQKIDDYKLFLSCLKELTEAVTELESRIDAEIEDKYYVSKKTGEKIEKDDLYTYSEGIMKIKSIIKQTLGGGG